MILKRNFHPVRVLGYVRTEMALSLLISVLVWISYWYAGFRYALPFSVAAILGSALAIFIAFRNNSAYARWWEARTLWGNIVNASRVLGRLIITFTDSHRHQAGYEEGRSEAFKKEMIYLSIAWAHALRIQLREEGDWQQLKHLMSEVEFGELQRAHQKPNQLHLLFGRKLYEAMANGTLGGFDSFQVEGQLLALANAQGACERIKFTPLLRQYHYFTRIFLFAFIAILPFALIGDFGRAGMDVMMVPVSLLIAFVFAIIGKVGEVNEDPFENRITDVPLTAICNTIERDLREMLGESELSTKVVPTGGFFFLTRTG
jgi:putative membrane protein